jgi:hypothetical protein
MYFLYLHIVQYKLPSASLYLRAFDVYLGFHSDCFADISTRFILLLLLLLLLLLMSRYAFYVTQILGHIVR